jgi:hypothetical protein
MSTDIIAVVITPVIIIGTFTILIFKNQKLFAHLHVASRRIPRIQCQRFFQKRLEDYI